MDNTPSLQERQAKFRNVTSSKEYNETQDEVLYDILNLFNKANTLSKELGETKDIIHIEQKYMQLKIMDLETKIAQLAQLHEDFSRYDSYKNLLIYPSNMYLDDKTSNSVNIDLATSSVTLPHASSTSKVNLYDEGVGITFVPPSLGLEVSPAANDVDIIDNEVSNAFNGDNSSYWRRKVITDNNINSVTCTLTIGIPEDMISSRDINSITINPYPFGSIDLVSIEYKLFGAWVPVPSFDQHSGSILETYSDVFGARKYRPVIPEIGNIRFTFKEINANEIRITFRQRNYIQEDGRRVFCLGAREIQVLNYKYNKDTASFLSKVEFPAGTIMVYDIVSVLNNQAEVGDNVIQYEFFTLDDFDMPSKITSGFPFEITNNKMLVKGTLYKSNTSPDLSKLKVVYQVK